MKKLYLVPLLSLALMVGCAKHVSAPVPGAVNTFDSDTYVSLVTAKATIDATKQQLSDGAFSPAIADGVKKAINEAVAAYNVLDVTYQAYHQSAVAGTATSAQQSAVQSAASNLASAVGSLTSAKGK